MTMTTAKKKDPTIMAINESDDKDNDLKDDKDNDKPWGVIKTPTADWKMISAETVESCSPFKPEDVFNKNDASVHALAALGERLLKLDPGTNASIQQ